MINKSIIIPAILTSNIEEFEKRLNFAALTAQAAHLDVIDGSFCEGEALDPENWPQFKLNYAEAHLMTAEPIKYFPVLSKRRVNRVIIHVEALIGPEVLAKEAKKHNLTIGLAVNPDTDLDELRPYYNICSYIQIMGVQPGRSNQPMIDLNQTKLAISYLKHLPNRRLTITVDGGVDSDNLPSLFEAGANFFVVSHAIFGDDNWSGNYANLVNKIKASVS